MSRSKLHKYHSCLVDSQRRMYDLADRHAKDPSWQGRLFRESKPMMAVSSAALAMADQLGNSIRQESELRSCVRPLITFSLFVPSNVSAASPPPWKISGRRNRTIRLTNAISSELIDFFFVRCKSAKPKTKTYYSTTYSIEEFLSKIDTSIHSSSTSADWARFLTVSLREHTNVGYAVAHLRKDK